MRSGESLAHAERLDMREDSGVSRPGGAVWSNQLFSYGPQRTTAGSAAAYSYLTPVLAWLILGEPITTVVVVCGLMIALGVCLLNQARERDRAGLPDEKRREHLRAHDNGDQHKEPERPESEPGRIRTPEPSTA
jgi:hypothetical protein